MKRLFHSVLLLLAAASAAQQSPGDARHSEEARQTAKARRAEIRSALETLGSHEWAGDYYAGDGMGVNQSLILAPGMGYVFEWHGCLGDYDRNHGEVTSEGRTLRLTFMFENKRTGFRGLAPELVAIPWGPRCYLVPADDIVGFCNDVNAGTEPRADPHGSYLLRRGDELKEVSGDPELPVGYRDHLLKQAVETSVREAGTPTLRQGLADSVFRDTPLILDAGSEQGLKPGMRLYVVDPPGLVLSVRLTQVEATASTALAVEVQPGNRAGPQAGWRLSTRPPWRALPAQ